MSYKKIAFFAAIVILLFTINDLAHSIYDIWQKQDLITQAQNELNTEVNENKQLKKQIAQVNQPQFVDSVARNNLLLAKPGEDVVIVPSNQLNVDSSTPIKPIDPRPNWKKWWDVFF
jgi:cell division protein FtsB